MRVLLLLALAFTVGFAFENVSIFEMDLDKPPQQRWDGAVAAILSRYDWNVSFGPLYKDYSEQVYVKINASARAALTNVVKERFPSNYQELLGLAQQFVAVGHPEVDINFLSFWVWYHELAHCLNLRVQECTGVLVVPQDITQGVIHGRNMDQLVPLARYVTLQIHVMKQGKLQYQIVDFYWMTTGFVTAAKFGSVTLQENWRSANVHPPQTLEEILDRIINNNNTIPQVLAFRNIMDVVLADAKPFSLTTFPKTLSYLYGQVYAAPFYAIISGYPRVGAVLSVSWYPEMTNVSYLNTPASMRVPGIPIVNVQDGPWFMIETNYDRWLPDPVEDNRRTVAAKALNSLGQDYGGTDVGVWMTMSEYPVHHEGTFYTVLLRIDKLVRGFVRMSITGHEVGPN